MRVEIPIRNLHKHDRNPKTGEHHWEALDYQRINQTIYNDRERPSRDVLPVLDIEAGDS